MLYDAERKWRSQRICEPEDNGLFFAESGAVNRKPGAKVQAAWDQAKEICRMCPVLNQCREATWGEPYGVWGGTDQYERHQFRQALDKAIREWSPQRRLAWGKDLSRLRDRGMKYHEIQAMTGIPEASAIALIREWLNHLAELRKQRAKVLELPTAGVERKRAPFPDTPGRRHCWVRNNGIVQDAFYQAETDDGVWTYVQLSGRAGRSACHKWIRTDDTRIYHPQPVVIRDFVGRPDREKTA